MYVQQQGYSRYLGVKRYKQTMDPTGSIFMEGMITIHELVLAKDNDGFSPLKLTQLYAPKTTACKCL
jgi:hypothetical protein